MKALLVLFGGNLTKYAFEPVYDGKNSIKLAFEQAKKFPGVEKSVLITTLGDFSFLNDVEIVQESQTWTKQKLLEKISELQSGFDLVYFSFADCPFIDPVIAGNMVQRHLKYAAEYSYADGFPFGLAPEILSPGTAGILAKIIGKDSSAVTSAEASIERDFLFSVIQKDINAFDIETEISTIDLSSHRLNLQADTRRNYLLLKNFIAESGNKIPSASETEKIVIDKPEILRTLPIFYPIQVYGGCPQSCKICPYSSVINTINCKDFMETEKFELLLDKITAFSGDAVIDLSLWGELSQHPEKMKLIEAVIKRRELSLIIETSGLCWKSEELEKCAQLTNEQLAIRNEQCFSSDKYLLPPVSWIVSLDTADSGKYQELRGNGFAEANECAKKLFTLFPEDTYVQAVRFKGSEEDTEKFYRYWKDAAPNGEKNIIIQKYDDFCGFLEKKQASDISPIIRQCCWHIMRDMPILINGTVPLCKEDISILKGEKNRILGNVFTDSLEDIWKKGEMYYKEHCEKNYKKPCTDCDEYYTYNF